MAELCPIHSKKHYPMMVNVDGGPVMGGTQVKVADHEAHGRLIGKEVSECGEIIEVPAEPVAPATPAPASLEANPTPPSPLVDKAEEDDNPLGN